MPRQQSSNTKSSYTPAPKTHIYAPPPKIWHASPPVAASPSIFQSVKDGIGLGAGSAIGHRIVGSLFGSTNPTSMPPPVPGPTQMAPLAPLAPVPLEKPYYASDNYIACIHENRETPQVCIPFLSKDKSPWTVCMEQNFYRADSCSSEPTSKSR